MYIGPIDSDGFVRATQELRAPTIVPFQNFEASDGSFVIRAAEQIFSERTCGVDRTSPTSTRTRGLPRWPGGDGTADELVPILGEIFGQARGGWSRSRYRGRRCTTSHVDTVEEALVDPRTLRMVVGRAPSTALGAVRWIRPAPARGRRRAARAPSRPRPASRRARRRVLEELSGWARKAVTALADASISDTVVERPWMFVGFSAGPPDPRWPDAPSGRQASSSTTPGRRAPHSRRPGIKAFLHEVVGAPLDGRRGGLDAVDMVEWVRGGQLQGATRICASAACR